MRSLVSLEEGGHKPLEVFSNSSKPQFGYALGPLKGKKMRNKTYVWIPCPAPENTHNINAEELLVLGSFLLVLLSKGFVHCEGRNPALQTLVRASGRKIDHPFQQENEYYEIMIKKCATIPVQRWPYSLPDTPQGRGFLHNTTNKALMVFPVATADMLNIWSYRQVERGSAGNLRISIERLAANSLFLLFSNDSYIFSLDAKCDFFSFLFF